MTKRREPMTLYEALEPLSDLWGRYISWLMAALIQPVQLLTTLTAWCVKHLWLLLALDALCALWATLAHFWPLGVIPAYGG